MESLIEIVLGGACAAPERVAGIDVFPIGLQQGV